MKSPGAERALVLAPQGRDAAIARSMLMEAGLRAEIVLDIDQLVKQLELGAGFAVITEEAIAGTDLHALARWIQFQPEWSDFPFVLVTQRGGGLERNPAAARYLHVLGNATFLERPFHPTTLVSLAQSALRARQRQYEAQARLNQLNELTADLERRVEERTTAHEKTVAQLHEVQKLETLGQLTGGVAHDFNNLLTPITGALDLLQRQYGEIDPRAGRLLGNALKAADRARTLVQRLLGFARRQSLETQAIDIPRLLAGMRDLISSSVGSTVEIDLRHDADVPLAVVDPNQLELAILNLCVNARDAMPDGGKLSMIVEEVTAEAISSLKLKPGTYVRLSVIDCGIGMSRETLARATEPFYSTKEVGRGTGLGLSMVHGLAAQLGGGISISSTLGEGTRVDLFFATTDNLIQDKVVPIKEAGRPIRHSLSVLLVDDEEIVRVATAEMIRDLGHEVVEASSAAEALNLLSSGLECEVVVTDYKMPRMDGATLAREVREIYPAIKVLLITGYTGLTQNVGNLPRLAKPFGRSEMSIALADLVQSGEQIIPFPAKDRGL